MMERSRLWRQFQMTSARCRACLFDWASSLLLFFFSICSIGFLSLVSLKLPRLDLRFSLLCVCVCHYIIGRLDAPLCSIIKKIFYVGWTRRGMGGRDDTRDWARRVGKQIPCFSTLRAVMMIIVATTDDDDNQTQRRAALCSSLGPLIFLFLLFGVIVV
jgi:hypothetical protein